jgi:hypothetical protein
LSCNKETSSETHFESINAESDSQSDLSLISNAKSLFENKETGASDRSFETLMGVVPIWDASTKSRYAGETEILIVPIEPMKERMPGSSANLIFFTNQEKVLDYYMLVHVPDSSYLKSKSGKINIKDYTGYLMKVKPKSNTFDVVSFSGGSAIGNGNGVEYGYVAVFLDDYDLSCTGPGCFCFSCKSFWTLISNFFSGIGGAIGNAIGNALDGNANGSNNNGSSGVGGIIWVNGGLGGFFDTGGINSVNGTSGGSNGSSVVLSNYFDTSLFSGMEKKNAHTINKFKDKICYQGTSIELQESLISTCGLTEDPDDLFLELKEITVGALPDCAKEVIIQDRLDFLEANGFNITKEQLIAQIGEGSLLSCNAGPDIENALINLWYQPPPPNTPGILNLEQSLNDCFGLACSNCSYTATLYIEQPIPGSRDIYTLNGFSQGSSGSFGHYEGHTFIGLSQTNSQGEVKSKIFGYYPASHPSGSEEVPGFFYPEDENTVYNIKVTYQLTAAQFNLIKTRCKNMSNMYAAAYNNCSTTSVAILSSAGLIIPQTKRHQWPIIGDIEANPADLGEDLRISSPGGSFDSSDTYQHVIPSNCQ